jgi:dTDP-4-amino-4,6-dideoxygalactose transaminase
MIDQDHRAPRRSGLPNPYLRLRLTPNVANPLPLRLASRVPETSQVSDFESAFSKCLGLSHSIATNSGRAAILLALRTLGIGGGDEVVIPSFVCGAVADAILCAGARPVLADANPDDGNMECAKLKFCLSPMTKAIIAVHYQGLPCDIDEISEVAKTRGVFLIEDCAHAVGSMHSSRKVGTIGDFAIFSFGPDKAMTTGLGGMLGTPKREFADAAKAIVSNEGKTSDAGLRKTFVEVRLAQSRLSYGIASQSYLLADRLISSLSRRDHRFNLTPISLLGARLGIAQLSLLSRVVEARRRNADRVRSIIDAHTSLRSVEHSATKEPSLLRLTALSRRRRTRETLSLEFKRRGIEAGPIDWREPLHQSPVYSKVCRLPTTYDGTDSFCNRFINLPVHPYLTESDFSRMKKVLTEAAV